MVNEYIPRQFRVLCVLDLMQITYDTIDNVFFGLESKYGDLDLSFENIVCPFSNNLHDALFDLRQSGFVTISKNLQLTELGKLFLQKCKSKYKDYNDYYEKWLSALSTAQKEPRKN